jgi:hypothetical protein
VVEYLPSERGGGRKGGVRERAERERERDCAIKEALLQAQDNVPCLKTYILVREGNTQ